MSNGTVSDKHRHLNAFYLAIGFFTRLPTRFLDEVTDEDMGRALVYMPVVGFVVGALTIGSGLALSALLESWHGSLSSLHLAMIGVVSFVTLVLASGGLHLDGLADCADAWIGGLGDKDRTLKILKDPLCGAMAVTILIVTLVVKAAAVVGLVLAGQWLFLLCVPVISRTSGLLLFLTTPYIRPKGLGKAFADFCVDRGRRRECNIALAAGLLVPALIMSSVWPALLVVALAWYWLREQAKSRLGGITGDVCGAMIELTEAILLLAVVLFA